MLRRLSSGELIDRAFTLFSFPTGWHYDALRGLDCLREAGVTPDPRVAEAIDLVRSKRDAEGRLPLENPHESEMVNARVRDLEFDMDEREGPPSRCNTLRALRVLRWAGRSSPFPAGAHGPGSRTNSATSCRVPRQLTLKPLNPFWDAYACYSPGPLLKPLCLVRRPPE